MVIYDCNADPLLNRLWILNDGQGGEGGTIVSGFSRACLALPGTATASGTKVEFRACGEPDTQQQWVWP